MSLRKDLKEGYSPMLFLASLGAGGAVITFFMYLLFMIPHKGAPIPRFEHIMAVLANGPVWQQALTVLALAGIVFFAFLHFRLLVWNITEYSKFKKTGGYQALRSGNAEVQLMAIPLTYGMSVNVAFILGALFVPGLWNVVEYLFPLALVAFGAIGIYAIKIFTEFFSRVLTKGGFDCEKNNSLAQMLAAFAFAMVGVGFSASGAMSHNTLTSAIGLGLSAGFVSLALLLMTIKIVLGFRAMFEHGVNKEASVSLWIVIPILTTIGIALYRISMGLHHNFDVPNSAAGHYLMFAVIVFIQMFFGLIGHHVMKRIGYYETFISGSGKSPVAYAAICPGIAAVVMANFLVNFGLVNAGIVPKFSIGYFALYLPIVYLQLKTIAVMFKLNRKLLKADATQAEAQPKAA